MYTLYLDETGSRIPKGNLDPSRVGRDWFALGGFIVKKEDETTIRQLHSTFIKKWGITKPLHMTDMLSCTKGFAWLGELDVSDKRRFWTEYHEFLASLPVVGHACVIDRPGYLARGYVKVHGEKAWFLCRTAFDIVVERSVKIARLSDRKLSVAFESADKKTDERTRRYHLNLKHNGLGFSGPNSDRYAPLEQGVFAANLSTIERKDKSSVMMQVADSYVYAIARGSYEPDYPLWNYLSDRRRVADTAVSPEHVASMGIKRSCFGAPETSKPVE